MEKWVAVIDLKAYYATFECVERGLDPFATPLAVTDTERKGATIVLSVSPYLKSLGVPSRLRRRDLPTNIPGMIYAKPQMEKYVKKSAEIVSIFLDFIGKEDLHVYSIDECFLDLTNYLKMYNKTDYEIAVEILNTIYKKTNIPLPYNYYIRQEIENKKTPWPIGLPYRLNIDCIFSDIPQ